MEANASLAPQSRSKAEALARAIGGLSASNYPAIFRGLMEKGIPESEIKPRENVFTYNAWRELGRQVRRGEHGVKVLTFIDCEKREKYRPRTIADFVGLEKPKRILGRFAARPYPSAWLFSGPSGTGKTSMALALAAEIQAELHHIPSQQCNVPTVEEVVRQCWYVPRAGGFHLVLVDEADSMTNAAQLHFLSKLDATACPPETIFVFTCNGTDGLEPRFLSRTRQIEFSSYGLASETVALLEAIWHLEAGDNAPPAFAQIVKQSRNNVRDALMYLETELLAV